MQCQGRLRTFVRWGCWTAALLTILLWISSRWIAVDIQTGTRVVVALDQGTLMFIKGDADIEPAGVELIEHDPDQVAWQWWFASYPNSFLLPLWVPFLTFSLAGLALSKPR